MVLASVKSRPNSTAAGLGGAIATVAIYAVTLSSGWDPPPELTALVVAFAATISVEFGQFVRANGKEKTHK